MERTREDLAWVTGIFEGEGTFVNRLAAVVMTDEDVVKTFYRIVGIGTIRGPYKRPGARAHYKPNWRWQVSSFEGYQAIIAMMWPWLHSRRKARAKQYLMNPPYMRGAQFNRDKKACPKCGGPYTFDNRGHRFTACRAEEPTTLPGCVRSTKATNSVVMHVGATSTPSAVVSELPAGSCRVGAQARVTS